MDGVYSKVGVALNAIGGLFSKFGAALSTSPPKNEARPAKRLSTSPSESETRPGKRWCAMEGEFGNYDVFISHRGPDTKTSFVSFLYDALKRVGLHPFLDCKSIGKGQHSWECIDHAIRTTPVALVIFSESFAQSEWCLRELHAMLNYPLVKVLPIFYNVEPWELRRLEYGKLGTGFKKLTKRHEKILIGQWRADLEQASNLNGWEHKVEDKRLEANLVQGVVGKIFELANKPLPLHVGDHVIGVKQIVETLIQSIDEKKVLMLGLWGMGGIGKTTLARELYNQLQRRFDASCYVGNVTEKLNHEGGVSKVQNKILKDLCGYQSMENILEESQVKVILEKRLSKKHILVVLDDVLDDDQMCHLMSRNMFKESSMCIVTSRDCSVFEKSTLFDFDSEVHIHEVQSLNLQDSRSVFACHAFGGERKVPSDLEGLVGDVSMACGGVPLVLEVCGCLLKKEKNVKIWEEILNKLNFGTMMDEAKIFKCLRISYDSLRGPHHQDMFLDVACALIGQSLELVKLVWGSQGWYPTWGIQSLVDKALIRVDRKGNIWMHDHLRDLGRLIARQERTSLGICKRLWGSELLALSNKNEILLDALQTLILPNGHGIQDDFSQMMNLRILRCEDGLFQMSSFPNNLYWLHMSPSFRHVPESPKSNQLVVLYWGLGSMKRLPESFGNLNKLKVLNLQFCGELVELPKSFGRLSNLEVLDLSDCDQLEELPKSFGSLNNLEVLDLSDCSHLEELPESFGSLNNLEVLYLRQWCRLFHGVGNFSNIGIRSLPQSFGNLSSLKELDLRNCGNLMKLPNSFGDLKNLKIVIFSGSGLQGLPKSFTNLSNLEVLNLGGCKGIVELPRLIGDLKNLKCLALYATSIRSIPESFGMLSNLEELCLSYCYHLLELPKSFGSVQKLKILDLKANAIRSLPESFAKLSNLEKLNFLSKLKLQSLPETFGKCSNLKELDLHDHPELIALPNSFGDLQSLEKLNINGSGIRILPKRFGMLKNLNVLDLGLCTQLEELLDSFSSLQNLKTLVLTRTRIQSLPKFFGTLNKMEVLNMLDCCNLMELPTSLEGLKNLKVLNLADCSKLMELPTSLGGLQNLTNLHLDRSGIQSLPKSFGLLSDLVVLSLGGCDHLVELPDLFGSLQNLKNLNLSRSGIQILSESFGLLNKLEILNLGGCNQLLELPNSFGSLQNLNELDLSSTGIRILPESFGLLSNLEVLNLRGCNQLVELPDLFGSLQNLNKLDLYESGIRILPKSFGLLTNLKMLDLFGCNDLIELPNSFGSLQNLNELDLSSTGIQILPESFGLLNKLKVLNLGGCNQLVELPNSFGSLQNLNELGLSGTGI